MADGITATFGESGPGGPLTLGGQSGLSKTGGGTLVLDLPSNVSGNTILTAGTLAVRCGALGREGNIVFDGGTLRLLPGNTTRPLQFRIRHGTSSVRIDTGGNDIVWATPLHASNTGGLVKLGAGSLALSGGIAALSGPVIIEAGALKLESATTGNVAIPNAGFESPAYNPQSWAYNPGGADWSFSSASGTASNNSPWVGASPEGGQVAFLQNNGTMSAEVSAETAGHYRLSFLAANRPGYAAGGLVVTLDGILLCRLSTRPARRWRGFQPLRTSRRPSHRRLPHARFPRTSERRGQRHADRRCPLHRLGIRRPADCRRPGPDRLPPRLSSPAPASHSGFARRLSREPPLDLIKHRISSSPETTTPPPLPAAISGSGTLTNSGTLRLVGDASLDFTGTFTNTGVLDIMTWNGTLPAGFVNHGIVLDRSAVKISSHAVTGNDFTLTIQGHAGHDYQLQRCDSLADAWQNLGPAQPGNNVPLVFTDPGGAAAERRFYRISVVP